MQAQALLPSFLLLPAGHDVPPHSLSLPWQAEMDYAVGAYARLREEILTEQSNDIERIDERLRDAARLISLLTGVYDEAARIAATYSQAEREPPER